jgi:hypothetical protein
MPRRASKKQDVSQNARRIVDEFIERSERLIDPAVSAAAAALSKLGASKGGMARKEALTPARRRQIAKKAATARWKQK